MLNKQYIKETTNEIILNKNIQKTPTKKNSLSFTIDDNIELILNELTNETSIRKSVIVNSILKDYFLGDL